MPIIKVAGTFTVNTVEDGAQGAPAPIYHEQAFAWSSEVSSVNNTTPPSDISDSAWKEYVPSKIDEKPYLWMRHRLMTWSNITYVGSAYTYTRLSGENGTGVAIKGSFSDTYLNGSSILQYLNSQYTTPSVGDGYIYQTDGHLWLWNGNTWQDVGQIKGANGTSQFIHLAWAHALDVDGYPTVALGFVTEKLPEQNYEYMGIYVDNTGGNDSQDPHSYEWNRVQGNGNVKIDLDNENDTMLYNERGDLVSGVVTSTARLYIGNEQILGALFYMEGSPSAGVTASVATNGTIQVSGITTPSGYVMVKSTYGGTTYYSKLTIKRIVGGDKYELVVLPNSISYNVTEALPATTTISVNIFRTDVLGVRTKLTALGTGISLTAAGDGTNISVSHIDGEDTWYIETQNAYYDECVVTLSKNGNVLDTETIPINKSANGVDGQNAVLYEIATNKDYIIIPSDSNSTSGGSFVQFFRIEGEAREAYSAYCKVCFDYVNGTFLGQDTGQNRIPASGYDGQYSADISVRAIVLYMLDRPDSSTDIPPSDYLARKEIPVIKNGNTGANGADGFNSIRLDLDNEMDSLQYNERGEKITQSVATNARLYDGTQLIDPRELNWSASSVGCVKGTATSEYVPFTVSSISSNKEVFVISVSYKGAAYSAAFVVNKLVGIDKYELDVAPNGIIYNTDDNTVSAERIAIKVYRTDSSSGVRSLIDTLSAHGLHLYVNNSEVSTYSSGYNIQPINTQRQEYDINITDGANVLDRESVPIAKVYNGNDSIYADLTNEMDSIALNADGNTVGSTNLSTTFYIYRGLTRISLDDLTYSSTAPSSSVGVVIETQDNKPTGVISITVANGKTFTDDKIEITFTGTSGTHVLSKVFTIIGIRGGATGDAAVIYKLEPSSNVIKMGANNVPTEFAINCSVLKRVGNSAPVLVSNLAAESLLLTEVIGGIEYASTGQIDLIHAPISDGVRFNLYHGGTYSNGSVSNGVLIDTENIPVIRDGADGIDGTNAYYLTISPSVICVETDGDGVTKNTIDVEVVAKAHTGTNQVPISSFVISPTAEQISKGITSFRNESISNGVASRYISIVARNTISNAEVVAFSVGISDGNNGTYTLNGSITVSPQKSGKHSVRLDIDNEMDTMLYSDINTQITSSVRTTARLFDGIEEVTNLAVWSKETQNCTGDFSSATPNVFIVAGISNDQLEGVAIIKATYKNVLYTASFSVKKLINTPKYQLVLSPNAITYNSSNDILSNDFIAITVQCTKLEFVTVGGEQVAKERVSYLQALPSGWQLTTSRGTISEYQNGAWYLPVGTSNLPDEITIQLIDSDDNVIDAETIPIATVYNGLNALVGDLSNEMDSVAMDNSGLVNSTTVLSTRISLFYGTERQEITEIRCSELPVGASIVVLDTETGNVSISIERGTSLQNDKAIISLTAECLIGSKTLDFTIIGVRGGLNGDPAVIYQLSPTFSAIKATKDGNSPQGIACYVTKSTGNNIVGDYTGFDNLLVVYSIDGGSLQQYAYTNATKPVVNVASATNNISFKLYRGATFAYGSVSGGTLIDIETIPVIKDGSDSINISVVPSIVEVETDADGYVSNSGTYRISVYAESASGPVEVTELDILLSNSQSQIMSASDTIIQNGVAIVDLTIPKSKTVSGSVVKTRIQSPEVIRIQGGASDSGIDYNFVGSFVVNPLKSGRSTFIVDLSNEMDAVAMDDKGNTISATAVLTTVSMYYGTEKQTLTNITSSGAIQGVVVTPNVATGVVEVAIGSGVRFTNDRLSISITASCAYGSKTIDFVIVGVRDGAVYQLMPSDSAISLNENTYSPSTVTCQVVKRVGTVVSNVSDMLVTYDIDGGGEQKYINGLSISHICPTREIKFRLYQNGVYSDGAVRSGTLIDVESLPVVKNGNNAVVAVTSPSVICVDSGPDGVATATTTYQITAKLYRGASRLFIEDIQVNIPSSLTGVSVVDVSETSADGYSATIEIEIARNASYSAYVGVIDLAIDGYDEYENTFVAHSPLTISAQKAGVPSLRCDLSNEMDSVAMSNDGHVSARTVITTSVALYYGTEWQPLTALTYGTTPSGISVTCNSSTGIVTVTLNAGVQITNDRLVLPINATCAYGSREVALTIIGVRAGSVGESAVIYQLSPSDSSIKKASDGLHPQTLECYVIKKVGETVSFVTNKIVTYSIDDGREELYSEPLSLSHILPSVNIRFRLYNSGTYDSSSHVVRNGVLIDVETIPVIEDGKSVGVLNLSNDMDAIQYTSSGAKLTGSVQTVANLVFGGVAINADRVTWGHSSSTCSVARENNVITVTGINNGLMDGTVTITATYENVTYSRVFSVKRLVDKDKFYLEVSPNVIGRYDENESTTSNSIKIKVWREGINSATMQTERSLVEKLGGQSGALYSVYLTVEAINENTPNDTHLITTSNTYNSGVSYPLDDISDTYLSGRYYFRVAIWDGNGANKSILDSENIPVYRIVDGQDGIDALSVSVSPAVVCVQTDSNGMILGENDYSVTISASTINGSASITEADLLTTPFLVDELDISVEDTVIVGDDARIGFGIMGGGYLTEAQTVQIQGEAEIDGNQYSFRTSFVLSPQMSGANLTMDLSNEMDAVAMNSDGEVLDNPTLQTTVSMYFGATPVIIRNIRQVNSILGVSVTTNARTGLVSVSINEDTSIDGDKFVIRLEGTCDYGTKTADFVIIGVRCGQDGQDGQINTIYQLLPSISAIKVGKNGYEPEEMTCSVIKKDGNVISNNTTGLLMSYIIDDNDEYENEYDPTHVIDIIQESPDKHIRLNLYIGGRINNFVRTGGTLIDTETIPVIYDGKDAAFYSIESSKEVVSIKPDTDSVSFSTNLSFWKNIGGTKSAYSCYCGAYARRTSDSSLVYLSKSNKVTTYTLNTIIQDIYSALVIVISNSALSQTYPAESSILVKKEIPIVKNGNTGNDGSDGRDGVDAVVYRIEIASAKARVDSFGFIHCDASWYVKKNVGGVDSVVGSDVGQHQFKLNNTSGWVSASSYDTLFSTDEKWDGVRVGDSTETDAVMTDPDTLDIRFVIDGNVMAVESIPFVIDGKMGRNYYYAGEYDSSAVYTTTDFEAPFVSITTNNSTSYYVRIGENRSISNISPETTAGERYWELMHSDFKYLITEAIFSRFAKLGSAVFNQDYMFSQHGYMRGFNEEKTQINNGSQYQYVDVTDIGGENTMELDGDTTPFIWNISNQEYEYVAKNSVTSGTYAVNTYMTIASTNRLVRGRYYTVKFLLMASNSGRTVDYKLTYRPSGSTSDINIGGERRIVNASTSKYEVRYFNFLCPADSAIYKLQIRVSSAVVLTFDWIGLRLCQFVPSLSINLMTGAIYANNIKARGCLHAESLNYSLVSGNSNNDTITIGDESVVSLGNTAVGTTVLLPDAPGSKGRIIEIFSSINNGAWYLDWDDSEDGEYLYTAWGTAITQNSVSQSGRAYYKLYSNGEAWIVLQAMDRVTISNRPCLVDSIVNITNS